MSKNQSRPNWCEVALSVYELYGVGGMVGAYHVGVEVYGLEWSFGGADEGTGVYMVHVGESTLGSFFQRVPLGKTKKSPEEVLDILADFRRRWRGKDYNLSAKNCVSFSIAFAKSLGVDDPPEWINSTANSLQYLTGAVAEDSSHEAMEEEGIEEYDDDELEEMAEDGDDIALLELVWRKGKEYTLEWVQLQQHNDKSEELLVEFRLVVPHPDDDGKYRNTVVGLLKDAQLKKAVHDSTGAALGLQWRRPDLEADPPEPETCPVRILNFNIMQNFRIAAKCRVTGGDHLNRLKRKPTAEQFAVKFRSSMLKAANWNKRQRELLEDMIIDTSPGQPALHERLLTRKGNQGGAIMFPRKEFVAPKNVQGMLGKLQELRFAVHQQTATHRTLKVMMEPKPRMPWWAG